MLRKFIAGFATTLIFAASSVNAQESLRAAGPPGRVAGGDDSFFMNPAWAPDGSAIAFTGSGYGGLWTVAPNGSGLRQVTDEPAAGFGFSWSSDGSALLARVAQFDGPRRLNAVKVFDLRREEARQLTEYRPQMPALPRWSGDDETILLHGNQDDLEVFSSGLPAVAGKSASAPTYLIAGERILRAEPDADRAEPVKVLPDERILNLASSPDRSRITFEVMGGNLYVASIDGRDLIDLGRGNRPSWSPDGRWVVFQRTEDDGHDFTSSDLFAVPAVGGAAVRLTDTPARLEMNPSWSPDGARIAFDAFEEGAIYILPVVFE